MSTFSRFHRHVLRRPDPRPPEAFGGTITHHQQNKYGNGQWGDIVGYSTSGAQYNTTPIHENQAYQVETPPVMPIQSAYIVPGPPSYTAHQPSQSLHPLITLAPWSRI